MFVLLESYYLVIFFLHDTDLLTWFGNIKPTGFTIFTETYGMKVWILKYLFSEAI